MQDALDEAHLVAGFTPRAIVAAGIIVKGVESRGGVLPRDHLAKEVSRAITYKQTEPFI